MNSWAITQNENGPDNEQWKEIQNVTPDLDVTWAINENGKYYNDLESNETLDALNWALRMLDTYDYPQPEGSEWDYWVEAFQNGKGAFIAGRFYFCIMHLIKYDF